MNIVDIVGGRKAAACLTGLIVVVGCFLLKGTVPKELTDTVQYIITTYLAGNIAADMVVVASQKVSAPKGDVTVDTVVADIDRRLNNLDKNAIAKFGEVDGRIGTMEQALKAQTDMLNQMVNIISEKTA